MHSRRTRSWLVLTVASGLACLLGGPSAQAQDGFARTAYGVYPRPRGTYGPRMSFGEFGYRMNYGYAFGSPYGGLGTLGYGFGYGVGPGYGPVGSRIYSSAYVAPGTNLSFAGYYPPFASYGGNPQNPAIFPPPAPNYGRVVPGSGLAPYGYRVYSAPVQYGRWQR
jgi:hypothetical protein